MLSTLGGGEIKDMKRRVSVEAHEKEVRDDFRESVKSTLRGKTLKASR